MSQQKYLQGKSNHRWGFSDSKFEINKDGHVSFVSDRYSLLSGMVMPNFRPYVERLLGIDDLAGHEMQGEKAKTLPAAKIKKSFLDALKKKFKKAQYSTDDIERLKHSHGQTTTEEVYKVLYNGKISRPVDLVFFCQSEKNAEVIVDLASRHDICLVPYGGGTSVSSSLIIPTTEKRTVVSVDMTRMNKIEWIDKKNLTACIQAGIVGGYLEQQLKEKGYTMGHEPDSIEFSTLGGWISTNASGMKRNKYGNIEDIVQSVNIVTPAGKIEENNFFDRCSLGIEPKKSLFGSEGNLGIITKTIVKLHPYPKFKKYDSLLFKSMKEGINFLYELNQQNIKPASIRLVDNTQFHFGFALRPKEGGIFKKLKSALDKFVLTKIKKFDTDKMCLATLVMEGEREAICYEQKVVKKLVKKHGGMSGGEKNGKRGYLLTNLIAYIRDFLSDYNIIGETMETTVPWDKIEVVGNAIQKELEKQHKKNKLPGKPYFSYRVTQLYHSSVCVYIMIGMYTKGIKKPEDVYAKIEKEIRRVILEKGGSLSHHHGVGKLRKGFLKNVYSPTAIKMVKGMKNELDPKNIFGVKNNIFY